MGFGTAGIIFRVLELGIDPFALRLVCVSHNVCSGVFFLDRKAHIWLLFVEENRRFSHEEDFPP
jgi:hypothetical protein